MYTCRLTVYTAIEGVVGSEHTRASFKLASAAKNSCEDSAPGVSAQAVLNCLVPWVHTHIASQCQGLNQYIFVVLAVLAGLKLVQIYLLSHLRAPCSYALKSDSYVSIKRALV